MPLMNYVLNVQTYTSLSVLATAIAVGMAYKSTPLETTPGSVVAKLLSSNVFILVIVNMAFTLLFLLAKLIQIVFFGRLEENENQKLLDKLLNYLLFKIVFVGAILEPNLLELLVWTSWFSILGFLQMFSLLARARFENHAVNILTPREKHAKVIIVLLLVLAADIGWFLLCLSVFRTTGPSRILLLTFECFTLFLDAVQTLIKYGIHLYDLSSDTVWEHRGTYLYYTEFVTDMLILLATFAHYVHILLLHGVSFTLIDLVLFLNMRNVFLSVRTKFAAYRNYRMAIRMMNTRYPDATREDLAAFNDPCAICREPMETGKKLSCNHIFHLSCLRSWLEQDGEQTCPTCRSPFVTPPSPRRADGNTGGAPAAGARHAPRNAPANQRGVLPSWFSQSLSQIARATQIPENSPLVARVQEVFPHMAASVIAADLSRTRSVEVTIENIMEGRLTMPPADRAEQTVPATAAHAPSAAHPSAPSQSSPAAAVVAPSQSSPAAAVAPTASPSEPTSVAPSPASAASSSPRMPSPGAPSSSVGGSPAPFSPSRDAPSSGVSSPMAPSLGARSATQSPGRRSSASPSPAPVFSLQERKQMMLEQARRKYIAKQEAKLEAQRLAAEAARAAEGGVSEAAGKAPAQVEEAGVAGSTKVEVEGGAPPTEEEEDVADSAEQRRLKLLSAALNRQKGAATSL